MIAYTPIDLPCKVPDYNSLIDYIKDNHFTNLESTYGYPSLLCPLASRYPVKNWRDVTENFSDHAVGFEQKDNYQLFFPPGVTELFPTLFELLYSLPYKQIIGAGLNLQTKTLPAHRDEILDYSDPLSPERYNVLLSPHYGQNSFFVSKDGNIKDYPVILEDYPVYAFNNKDFYHGADPVLDNRIIMICSGIIDHERHTDLINRSAEKFKDYVIRY